MRRDPAKAAARGLHWGSPCATRASRSSTRDALYYRGQDAVRLAESANLEDVAGIPVGGGRGRNDAPRSSSALACRPGSWRQSRSWPGIRWPCSRPPCRSPRRPTRPPTTCGPPPFDKPARASSGCSRRSSRHAPSTAPMHAALAAAWSSPGAAAGHAIRRALVLCADHELNVSAFAARCAASAGASPYDDRLGRTGDVQRLSSTAAPPDACWPCWRRWIAAPDAIVIASRLRRGEPMPGFGHPLYPDAAIPARFGCCGSRKAAATTRSGGECAASWQAGSQVAAGPSQSRLRTGGAGADLPDCRTEAPALLFALGRTVGWIAHALEEYAVGELIRPRARYTGPPPEVG